MADAANLEDGFYWVRLEGRKWQVARLVDGVDYFASTYSDGYVHRKYLEIDPRPIKREE